MRQFIIAMLIGCAMCGTSQAEQRQPGSATLQDFTGQYVLEDGRLLTVTQRQRTLAAQVDGRAMVLLRATGPATFAAPAGALIVAFDQRNNGNVAGVTVTEAGAAVRQAGR